MNTLEVKDFTSGWIASDDQVSGRKNGLVRMDNGMLDEYGAITIPKAFNKVHTTQFGGSVHSIYSRSLAGTKCRYVGLSNSSVLRDKADDFATTILSGGGTAAGLRTGFGAGYNFVYITSGSKKKKDNGTTVYNLGVTKPTVAVGVVGGTSPQITLTDSYAVTLAEGSNLASGAAFFTADSDTDTFRIDAFKTFSSPLNTMDFGSSRYGTEDDKIAISVRLPDFDKLERIQIQFYFGTVDGSPDTSPDLKNYYAFEWIPDTKQFIREGKDQWSRIHALRSQFTRFGDDSSKDWSNVNGVRFVAKFSEAVTGVGFSDLFANGSDHGPLNGNYEYLQINVGNNGSYLAKSPAGPSMNYQVGLNHSFATVTPQDPSSLSDSQINEVHIYRRKVSGEGTDPSAQFLRVKVLTSSLGTAFSDIVSDTAAVVLNIKLNQFLISLQDSTFPDDSYYIEVSYFERTLYMTPREIWVSERLNPDAVDVRYTLKLAGNSSETNLFMTKTGPSTILIATTHDFYELSGTLEELPDGTIDLVIKPLGIKQPAIDDSFCVYGNALFYLGNDGLRILSGSTSETFNGNLDLLFKGYTRYGQLPVYNASANNSTFSFATARNKLYVNVTLSDTTRSLYVYDFQRKYWYLYYTDPASLFTEEDGTLLAGYADASDFYLRQLEVGTKIDGANGQLILLRWPVINHDLPLNRKDSFTLKFKIDTGGQNVACKIYKDESSSGTTVGTINCSGITEVSFDISSSIGIVKSWQLELSSAQILETFKLTEWAIEYDTRPKQTKYLRIVPNNYGTAGRKRFPTVPFLIDTLGTNVTFTPVIDNVDKTTSTVNTPDKEVHNHLFTSDEKGYVIGGKLQGNSYFEFYDLVTPRVIELLPDPVKFFHIPYTDLGYQGRKRIIAIALVIDTGGSNVTFTPIVDGVSLTTSTINTAEKLTYIHYFTSEIIGTDIGGTLSGSAQFEYYGILLEDCISEKMPPPAKFLVIPENNFGVAAKKRVRTIPMVINTRGVNVTFTPIVDGTSGTPATFNTATKRTVLYYFEEDSFGIDYRGNLSGASPFEFYGFQKLEQVEVIPVGKKWDQLGPIEFPKIGKVLGFRIRLIPEGTSLTYTMYAEDTAIGSVGTITTAANKDQVVEVKLPKGITATVFRVELKSNDPFHRYYARFRVNKSGMESEPTWMTFGADPDSKLN